MAESDTDEQTAPGACAIIPKGRKDDAVRPIPGGHRICCKGYHSVHPAPPDATYGRRRNAGSKQMADRPNCGTLGSSGKWAFHMGSNRLQGYLQQCEPRYKNQEHAG